MTYEKWLRSDWYNVKRGERRNDTCTSPQSITHTSHKHMFKGSPTSTATERKDVIKLTELQN